MKKNIMLVIIFSFFTLVFLGLHPSKSLADGNDILGTPSISIASGSDVIVAGTGMLTQPATIDINIPAGVTIKQVLLYWHGIPDPANPVVYPEDTITIEGLSITGKLIGTSYRGRASYRADITANGIISSGANSFSVEGLDFTRADNGAGLLVIIDDGLNTAKIDVRDGDDFAYHTLDDPYDTTVKQTFYFPAEDAGRTATISMFFASVSGTASHGDFRPTAIEVTVGGSTTVYNDRLDSLDGEEWDTLVLSVDIPAQTDTLTIQPLSVDNEGGEEGDPASFDWIAAALSVPTTSGGDGCTPGYWKQEHHFFAWYGYTPDMLFSDVFEDAFPGMTLLEVLEQGGGGLNALGRHTVAALLNASSPNTNYDLWIVDVIDSFESVYPGSKKDYNLQKDIFQFFNEQGCPLGNSKDEIEDNGDSDSDLNVSDMAASSLDSSTLSTDGASSNNGGGGGGVCFISSLSE
jgi:hypothetical protein